MPLYLLALTVLCSSVSLAICLQVQSNKTAGGTVRVTLSDYSNPHQVIAETGVKCDGNSNCDPYFVVKLGLHQYALDQRTQQSQVFFNRYNLSGEFYTAEFDLTQELPDAVFIRVTVLDDDPLDSSPYQVIAEPDELTVTPLLPSTASQNSSVERTVLWTPGNQFVRFNVKVEAACWPGVYGRRCNVPCSSHGDNGDNDPPVVYRTCDRNSGGGGCSDLDVVGCGTADGDGDGDKATAKEAATGSSGQFDLLSAATSKNGLIILAAVVAVVAVAALTALIVRRRRKFVVLRPTDEGFRLSLQGQAPAPAGSPWRQQPAAAAGGTESFRNPLYNTASAAAAAAPSGEAAFKRGQRRQQNATTPTASAQPPLVAAAAVDDTCGSDPADIYEEADGDLQHQQPPQLPPRTPSMRASITTTMTTTMTSVGSAGRRGP